jgi:PleD family two-component response regulator
MQNEPIRVLIVNGAPLRDDHLSASLTSAGFDTRVVSDSVSAGGSLDVWRPALVVVDLRAPASEGYRFLADLAGLAEHSESELPVVLVGDGSNLIKPSAIVPAGLVPTPIDEAHLVATVRRAVRTARPAREGSSLAR